VLNRTPIQCESSLTLTLETHSSVVSISRHEIDDAGALTSGFVAGDYRAAPITETCGLGEAVDDYREVGADCAGRVVLRPQE
jgi:hypothetical protein